MFKERKNRINYIYIPLLLCSSLKLFYTISNLNQLKSPLILSHILDFVIVFLIYLFFSTISGSTFRGTLITSIVFFILGLINQLKIIYSSEPIYIKDILYLNSASTFNDILDDTLLPIIGSLWWCILLFVLVLAITCVIAKKFDHKYASSKRRVITFGVTVFVFTFMFLPITAVNDLFIKVFFEVTADKNNNTTTNVRYYSQHTMLAGMYGQYLTSMLREPKDYNHDKIQTILNQATDTVTDKNFQKPNIVMVFSESFWDIEQQDSITFNKKITKNYNALKSKGMYIDMISPIFGGISCNTEFEMLTGGSLTYYPDCYIPYMNLYNSDGYINAPSIINELNNNDYETTIVSAWDSDLFNCSNVYDYFQVDNVFYNTDLKDVKKKGGRISDDYLADNIINTFNNKDKSKPLFHMTLTAEAHMPYNESKFDKYDINVSSSSLSAEETGIVKSYAQGIYDADKMLKKLYDYIQTFDEPTILIFYGDHLPFLQTPDGKNVYENIDYFNTGDTTIDTFRKYNTGCLILDNYGLQYEQKKYMSPYLVMPYVLNHMDISLSSYYKWLYTTIDSYPANNNLVSVNSKGMIVPTNSLQDEKTTKCSKLLSQVNWQMFVDNPANN